MVACPLLGRRPSVSLLVLVSLLDCPPLSSVLVLAPTSALPVFPDLGTGTASPRSRSPQCSVWEPQSSCLPLTPFLRTGTPSSVKPTFKALGTSRENLRLQLALVSWKPPGPPVSLTSCNSPLEQNPTTLPTATPRHATPRDPQPHFWLYTPRLVLCSAGTESRCM